MDVINMNDNILTLAPIAYIENCYKTKFGVPRQSGIVNSVVSKIILDDKFRDGQALRELETYSHIWLIWGFSQNGESWSHTVRPPKLGGNKRVGVFASRSPFRPNPIGLSCVKIKKIEFSKKDGYIIYVIGADLANGTPIYDIKPYIPYADCHPDATGSFSEKHKNDRLQVCIPNEWKAKIPEKYMESLCEILALDPRPAYQHDPDRVYGFPYANMEIKFIVQGQILTVCNVEFMD